MCIKVDLGYFDKDVVLDSFLQGKKFCNFVFSFICVIYKWGGDFVGVIFPGGNFLGDKFLGSNFIGGNFLGGNFPDT